MSSEIIFYILIFESIPPFRVPRSQFIPQMHRCFDAIHNGPSLVADVSEAGSGVEHPDSIETDSEYSDTPDPELVDALSTSSKSTGESWVTLNDFVVTFADEAEVSHFIFILI